MERVIPYYGTRDDLVIEINETKSVINADEPLHEDPVEDLAIRGIWSALLDPLLLQLEELDRITGQV